MRTTRGAFCKSLANVLEKVGFSAVVVVLAGCASSGVVQTGPDTYVIAKSEWGFTSGAVHAARLTQEASDHCRSLGKVVKVTSIQKNDVELGKTPAAEVNFQCVAK
jgi:hypothetical protein